MSGSVPFSVRSPRSVSGFSPVSTRCRPISTWSGRSRSSALSSAQPGMIAMQLVAFSFPREARPAMNALTSGENAKSSAHSSCRRIGDPQGLEGTLADALAGHAATVEPTGQEAVEEPVARDRCQRVVEDALGERPADRLAVALARRGRAPDARAVSLAAFAVDAVDDLVILQHIVPACRIEPAGAAQRRGADYLAGAAGMALATQHRRRDADVQCVATLIGLVAARGEEGPGGGGTGRG